MINDERKLLLGAIRSRLLRLKSIVDTKLAHDIPVNKRELACLKRFSFVFDDIDTLEANSKKIADKIIRAAEVEDSASLVKIELFPRVEPPPSPRSEELDIENLISDYVQQNQYSSFEGKLKGIRVSDIIAAVDMESGNSKVSKKVKRKTGRTKGASKRNNQPPAKKEKTRDQLRSLPPVLTQYVRGFFNVLRIILLTLGDAGGMSTEHLCDTVHFWNSNPRVQRTNSPWISKYADWSGLVRPALVVLSGRSALTGLNRTVSKESAGLVDLERLLPPAFVVFNAATRMWCWVDNGLDEENEASLLARLFALWVRKDGSLKHHCRSHLDVVDKEEAEDEDGGEDEEDRSRRRALRIDRIPPPHFATDWQCKLSTPEQRRIFQIQEEERYSRPWEPYIYNQHGYAAVVGPVLRAVGGEGGGRMRTALSAREHPLLRPNRPPWVSLSEIVRDAVARLPNGEGTRPEIAMLVQDSGFLVTSFSQKQLNQCISSALDRLQSEGANSPVMYDPVQRLWIYRFRHLSPPDFCRLYKDQIAFQRERFFQIYPGGGYRRLPDRPQPRRRREEPLDDQHIPDIDELTREEVEMEEGDEEYYSSSTDDGSREEDGGASMAFFSQPRRMRLEYKHQHHSHHSEQL
ncbi:Nuclear factor related to kappa-B-binding protein [Taenia crassiceps]|uniref:Nuclear factor related to kappa-B-binding protein n=1 Tax=Taenia crassiceps TaxID=6207 RepID=A0ABR4PZU6_9CEST